MVKATSGDKLPEVTQTIEQQGGKQFLDQSSDWEIVDGGQLVDHMQSQGVYMYKHQTESIKVYALEETSTTNIYAELDLPEHFRDLSTQSQAQHDDRCGFIEQLAKEKGGLDYFEQSSDWYKVTEENSPLTHTPQRDHMKHFRSQGDFLAAHVYTDKGDEDVVQVTFLYPFSEWPNEEEPTHTCTSPKTR